MCESREQQARRGSELEGLLQVVSAQQKQLAAAAVARGSEGSAAASQRVAGYMV